MEFVREFTAVLDFRLVFDWPVPVKVLDCVWQSCPEAYSSLDGKGKRRERKGREKGGEEGIGELEFRFCNGSKPIKNREPPIEPLIIEIFQFHSLFLIEFGHGTTQVWTKPSAVQ